jgi:hypothetical protein
MKASATPRFDVDAVRDIVGARTFARGEACFANGQVTLLVVEPVRVVAEVAGTWATARRYGASKEVKESLARDSETTHPAEAVQVYRESIERLAALGGDDAYRKAAALIARMAPLRGAEEHAANLAAIKARHGRKRNFMKLLG